MSRSVLPLGVALLLAAASSLHAAVIILPTAGGGNITGNGTELGWLGTAFASDPTTTWNGSAPTPAVDSNNASGGTWTANKGYLDLGTNWANATILSTWVQTRNWNSANPTTLIFSNVYWSDTSAGTINRGTSAINFGYIGSIANSSHSYWLMSENLGAGEVPLGRYLIVQTVGGSISTASDNFSGFALAGTTAVPEPSTWALLAFGLAAVLVLRRRLHSGGKTKFCFARPR